MEVEGEERRHHRRNPTTQPSRLSRGWQRLAGRCLGTFCSSTKNSSSSNRADSKEAKTSFFLVVASALPIIRLPLRRSSFSLLLSR